MPAVRFLGLRVSRLLMRGARLHELVAKHRSWLPIVVIVVAGALLSAWAGEGFRELAERVHANAPALQKFDSEVHDWAVSHRSPADTLFFVVMSTIGGPSGIVIIVAVVAIALAFLRRWRWMAYLVITVGGGQLLDVALKHYFARARPAAAEMLRLPRGYSFPSGHAMGSAVAFGALSYLAFRAARGWAGAAAAPAFGITFVLAVSLSRVYLGVHWISDVAAGVTAGLVWVTSMTVAYETLRRIRHLRGLRESRLPRAPSAANTDREPSVRS